MIIITHQMMATALLVNLAVLVIVSGGMLVLGYIKKAPAVTQSAILFCGLTVCAALIVFSIPCTGYQMIQFGMVPIPEDVCLEFLST